LSEVNQFLRVAKITGAHGLNGRLKLDVITDIIERFAPGNKLYIKIGNQYKPFISTQISDKSKSPLLKLEEINDRDAALSLKGAEIYITRSEAEKTRDKLDSDSFYYFELIGCSVFVNNESFGRVADIMEAGGNKILVLNNNEGKEFLVPFNKSMVDTAHVFNGRIDINPIEGLFDSEE
jgi:16S rRNA processing protein RimM